VGAIVMAERCESYHAIDFAWLGRRKMLKPGRASSIKWSNAAGAAVSVGIVASGDCVHLTYRYRAGDSWQKAREAVSFTYTRTCFSGRRRWFACPACGKACRVLFGVPFPSVAAGVTGSTTAPSINLRGDGQQTGFSH
jgi:hypothetical protein